MGTHEVTKVFASRLDPGEPFVVRVDSDNLLIGRYAALLPSDGCPRVLLIAPEFFGLSADDQVWVLEDAATRRGGRPGAKSEPLPEDE